MTLTNSQKGAMHLSVSACRPPFLPVFLLLTKSLHAHIFSWHFEFPCINCFPRLSSFPDLRSKGFALQKDVSCFEQRTLDTERATKMQIDDILGRVDNLELLILRVKSVNFCVHYKILPTLLNCALTCHVF